MNRFKKYFTPAIGLTCITLVLVTAFSLAAQGDLIDCENDFCSFLPLVNRPSNQTAQPTPVPTSTTPPEPTITPTTAAEQPTPTPAGTDPKITSVRNFIFGHSLLVHTPPLIETPSDETTVPHWLYFLAQSAGYSYAVDGQYGFLPQHAQLPPFPQWGFEHVPGVWDMDSGQTFAESDFTTVLLTAGNFIQYQPATTPYDGDNPDNQTPLNATLEIIDWVQQTEPTADIYIYENWPDMAPFMQQFPPTAAEFAAYNSYTEGDFHAWWVAYMAEIEQARPSANVVMIPIGPIISRTVTGTPLDQIPITELYEDDAPHGRPTLYFLASLTTYMSIYGEQAPANFVVPDTVHPLVRDNYSTVVTFIWDELVAAGVVSN